MAAPIFASGDPKAFALFISLSFPGVTKEVVVPHLKKVLADPHFPEASLSIVVDNLLAILNNRRHDGLRDSFMDWSEAPDIVNDGNLPQTVPFLRLLGRKLDASYPIVETLTKGLKNPLHMQAFFEGFRQNALPIKCKWPADRYVLAIVNKLIKSERINPSCMPALEEIQKELDKAVASLPSPSYPGGFDFKAAAAQKKELLTPKNRLTWNNVTQLYASNLLLTRLEATVDRQGKYSGHTAGAGSAISAGVPNLVRYLALNGKLSRPLVGYITNPTAAACLQQIEQAPLQKPTDAPQRNAERYRLLSNNFLSICSLLTEEDKSVISNELERILLEAIFALTDVKDLLGNVDDRIEIWFLHWLIENQTASLLSIQKHQPNQVPDDPEKHYHLGLISYKQAVSEKGLVFPLIYNKENLFSFMHKQGFFKNPEEKNPEKWELAKLPEEVLAFLQKHATQLIMDHRKELVEKTFAEIVKKTMSP